MLISSPETKTAMPWNYKLSWVLNNMSHPTALLIALSYWTMLSQRKYMYICFWCKVNQTVVGGGGGSHYVYVETFVRICVKTLFGFFY